MKKLTQKEIIELNKERVEKLREAARICDEVMELVDNLLTGKQLDLPARILGHNNADNRRGVEKIMQLRYGVDSDANSIKQNIGRFKDRLKQFRAIPLDTHRTKL